MKLFQSIKTTAIIAGITLSTASFAFTVNGKKVDDAFLDMFAAQQMRGATYASLTPEQQEFVRGEVANLFLLAEKAKTSGVADKAEVKAQVEIAQMGILARSQVSSYIDGVTVDEADLQALYKKNFTDSKAQEYNAAHILVKDETLANDLAKQLKDGGDFAKLAEEHSTDPGSARKGGDLGWFKDGVMVPEFQEGVRSLEKGGISAPVKSQFGYHIIRLIDVRDLAVPSYEQSRQKLTQQLKQEALMDYITNLKVNADISE